VPKAHDVETSDLLASLVSSAFVLDFFVWNNWLYLPIHHKLEE
jgi:hypothetical protein